MATTYPSSKQSFSNPSGGTNLASIHAALHADKNDTIEALEDALGYGTTAGQPPYGFLMKNAVSGRITFKNNSGAADAYIEEDANDDIVVKVTEGQIAKIFDGTNDLFVVDTSTDTVSVKTGQKFRTYNPANSAYSEYYTDSSNNSWALIPSATTSWSVASSAGTTLLTVNDSVNAVMVREGWGFRVYDSANTDYVLTIHDGTTGQLDSATGNLEIQTNFGGDLKLGGSTAGANVDVNDGATLRVYNTGNTLNSQIVTDAAGDMNFTAGTTGRGFDFDISSNNEWIKIPVLAGDPGTLENGMIWYSTATNTFRCRENGATRTL